MTDAFGVSSIAFAAGSAPAFKRRKSVSDFRREQQVRSSQGGRPPLQLDDCPGGGVLVALGEAEDVGPTQPAYGDAVSTHYSQHIEDAGNSKAFETAAEIHAQQATRRRAEPERQASDCGDPVPTLLHPDDLAKDISVKTNLRLTTSHVSFKWLQRLPLSLRSQPVAARCSARDEVLDLCRECLPDLQGDPDKAVRWMDQIVGALSWSELEGPVRPGEPRKYPQSSMAEGHRAAWKRVDDWDEAFRCLEVMLRQGLISTFVIEDKWFTVTVLGEGAGDCAAAHMSGATQRPTKRTPIAVMCPSQDDVRKMLQRHHAAFKVAGTTKPCNGPPLASEPEPDPPADEASTQLVAAAPSSLALAPARSLKRHHSESVAELVELRKMGEKVLTEEEQRKEGPQNSALFFEGAWRVHAVLDVLRQHFLAAPLSGSPTPANLLPRLSAPAPFCHASARFAEVTRTHTANVQAADGAPPQRTHVAELSGRFFPSSVRSLLSNLRVPLPSFECQLSSDAPHCAGANAFTPLGMRRVVAVKCERSRSDKCAAGAPSWRWEFSLGA